MPIYNRKPIEEEKPKRYSLFSPREMMPAEGMPELAPMEQEAPKKMSLFSPPAASPDQSPDLGNMVEPKKKGFGTKFKEFFTGQDLPGGTDELGLQKPDTHKEGVGGKILSYLLPFLFGATGAPAAGALAGSYFANKSGKNAGRQDELEYYQKQRTLKQKELAPSEYEKKLNTYFNLSPQQRTLADQQAAASKQLVNPLDADKFRYQQEKDAMDRLLKMQEKDKGAQLPADKALVLSDGSNLPRVLGDLREAIKQNQSAMGPIAGRIRKINPFDTQAQVLASQVEAAKQLVGKFMEGGVLRAEDVPKYDRILAGLYDDPQTALAKIDNMQKELEAKYNQHLDSLGSAKFDISGFSRLGAASPRAQPSARVRPSTPVAPPSNEQSAAIQWAKANPNDPKAALILKHAGGG